MSTSIGLDDVLSALSASGQAADRLKPAVSAAEAVIADRLPTVVQATAVNDLRQALQAEGATALGGGDPQRVEDALLAASPDSPLDERTLRLAWLALVDHLARSGDKPPFGGAGRLESWAFTARARRWPHVDLHGDVASVAGLFGDGAKVVVVRGPGRSAFLAGVRRALLGQHGVEALVPPILQGARDDLGPIMRPMLDRSPLDENLAKALDQLRFGEDFIGAFGRAGDKAPIALLIDDAWIQARALLLGLALFMEPAPGRNALLVVAGADDPAHDGPLSEVLGDARDRGILHEVHLPAFDEALAKALIEARFGEGDARADWAAPLVQASAAGADEEAARPSERLAAAHDWLEALAGAEPGEGRAALEGGYQVEARLPKVERAREMLAAGALEGLLFHGLTVGKVFGHDEDFVEDLLFDDEHEIDGEVVGTCEGAVPPGAQQWTDMPDGLHPVFELADMRLVLGLRARLSPELRRGRARALRDALLQAYQGQGAWQVADRLWWLDQLGGRDRRVETLLVGQPQPSRVDAAFSRLLPVLNAKLTYRLALARLYGAGMEAGALGARTGRLQLADQGFQASAASAQRLQRPGPAGEALARLGEMRVALALPQPARAAIDLAGKLLEQSGHQQSLARLDLMRAEIEVLEANLPEAEKLLEKAATALRGHGDLGHVSLCLVRQGRLIIERGDQARGMALLDEALQAADQQPDPRPRAAARMARARVAAESGALQPAFQLLQQAAGLFQAAGVPPHAAEAAAAGLQRRSGNPAEAEGRLRRVADGFKQMKAAVQWADAWQEVGLALMDQEKFTEAGQVLNETVDVRKRARDRFALLALYDALATAAEGAGDAVAAVQSLARGRRIAEILNLSHRMGAFDGALARLAPAIDEAPDLDLSAITAEAASEIDELEALWKAPPQPAQGTNQVH